ncbi:MAG: protein kinase domain-containing protein [Cetobacterium sp.]
MDKSEYIDEKGYKYKLKVKLAEGGQGKVYRTHIPQMLVKISEVNNRGDMKWKVNKIRSLNLPSYLNLALPLYNLNIPNQNHEAYVMRMMEDMEPILLLMKNEFNTKEECLDYYNLETGGLEKRLKVLKKIAYNLFSLHSRGIVYGDISPNNIFVSKSPLHSEAWFIDCDNLSYSHEVSNTIGTIGFIAPEIRASLPPYNENRRVNTIESDRYSFAILAFHILFLADPFRGEILDEDSFEEDNWDSDDEVESDSERKFDLGEVSWIGEGDEKNKPVYGLSTEIDSMLSSSMKELFSNTLGYSGRHFPQNRPSMRIWYEEINNMLNSLKKCECGYSYFKKIEKCVKCDSNISEELVFLLEYPDNKKNKTIYRSKVDFKKNGSITFDNSDLGIGRYREKNKVCFEMSIKNKKYIIENKMDEIIKIIERNELDGEETVNLRQNKKDYFLKFEDLCIELPKTGIKISIGGNCGV